MFGTLAKQASSSQSKRLFGLIARNFSTSYYSNLTTRFPSNPNETDKNLQKSQKLSNRIEKIHENKPYKFNIITTEEAYFWKDPEKFIEEIVKANLVGDVIYLSCRGADKQKTVKETNLTSIEYISQKLGCTVLGVEESILLRGGITEIDNQGPVEGFLNTADAEEVLRNPENPSLLREKLKKTTVFFQSTNGEAQKQVTGNQEILKSLSGESQEN